ncbi:hypothetical protein KM043_006060 [Ampulex compressa]|nr:hypothetical protein KM043_006060 [Ampulex compressa]
MFQRDGTRFRGRTTKESSADVPYDDKVTSKKAAVPPNETQHLLFVLTFFLFVSFVVIVLERNLPEPLTIAKEDLFPERFVAERARNHVANLTSIGPRVAGSRENEVLAVDFLTATVDAIVAEANENHRILVDVVKHSGAFPLTFLDGMTNVYRNVRNVVVKIEPRGPTPGATLLVNCHFDSFAESPGGSDDAAGCAVMLEVLRVIARSPRTLKHGIVFLFNGAEENILQASHGFITQHRWADEIAAFINLEACGAGGRELLFQAGPNSPWILEAYSKFVPYPYASSLAQEIFESGIVPGDTDFRIFRDFGNISGLDFAWATNGYVYHTRFDTAQQIPLGSLQRTGDNILALVRGIMDEGYLVDAGKESMGSLVFFDFLGAFVIRWPPYVASSINIFGIILGLCSTYLNMQNARKDLKKSAYLKHLLICVGTIIASWLLSMLSCTLIALLLTKLGKVMSWYARPAWLFFLYVCPTVFASMTLFQTVGSWQRKEVSSAWFSYLIYYDAYALIWMSILFTCVLFEIRSGFIPLHWVFFSATGNIVRHSLFDEWRGWKWIFYHLGTLSLPFVQSFYLTIGALYLFIPVMGRFGGSVNSEVVMANMLSLLFCLLLSFVLPIGLLVKNAERVTNVLIGIFLIAVGLLILTPLGFPYSGDPLSPAPERFMIAHTQRQYHNASGAPRYYATGYWIVDLDMNSPRSVEAAVPEISAAMPTLDDCEKELYCGLPYLMPVTTFLRKTSWIPGPAPIITVPARLELISKAIRQQTVDFTFNITGPDHMGIMLSPYKGVYLDEWSILDGLPLPGPKWNDRETYFVYYSCVSDCTPYTFSLRLNVSAAQKTPCLTIALAGHFLHGQRQKSARFQQFLDQFPSWTVVTPWTATYSSWEF